MTNESNQDYLTTLRLMVEAAQRLFLLKLLEDLLSFYHKGDKKPSDIDPAIIRFFECAKARYDDPSFRHTLELATASLKKASDLKGKELGITMPTEVSNRYITLIDDLNRQLARLDEEISQP